MVVERFNSKIYFVRKID